jgi:hypothetical protein
MAAASDEERGRAVMGDAFRLIQDVGGRLSDAARSMADDFAASPAAQFAEPMARLGAQMAELSTAWVGPVRAILEEQQELIDTVAAWAEQQRELADRFAVLADRHRALTAQTMSVLQPLLDGIEKLNPKHS